MPYLWILFLNKQTRVKAISLCIIFLMGLFFLFKTVFFSRSFFLKPRLTVFIIVDQMAWGYLKKIKPFISGGLELLASKGLIYDNAHVGHAMPSTASGHTAFNMGSYPSDHGIVGNKWIDKKTSAKIACDQDPDYHLFSSANTVMLDQEGKSPVHINGIGLSESCALSSSGSSTFHVYSISGKSRGAICTANKLGKPLWFDEIQGGFISSTYYFKTLPNWLVRFNQEHDISHMHEYTWRPYFDLGHAAYDFPFHDNYEFTAPKNSFINKTYPLNTAHSFRLTKINPSKGRFSYLQNTPFVNERIFECAQTVIQNTLINNNDRLLLWLSLSSLDKVGHIMGPSSVEVLDILYHLDSQLKSFFSWIDKEVGLSNTLIVLTSDHGMTDIPEISFKKGITQAERISELAFINDLNKHIFDLFGISNAIRGVIGLQLHLNTFVLNHSKREEIERSIVSYLKTKPYIYDAWQTKILKKLAFDPIQLAFKRQIYQGRTGQIMFQLKAHKLITHYPDGASHESPYSDDTHIPLIFYQKGITKHRLDDSLVYVQQVANTIAHLLEVPQVQSGEGRIIPGFCEMKE